MSENIPHELAEVIARFDARAEHYDESAMHRGLAAAVADFASLDDVDSVLDIATGTGLVLRALRSARLQPLRLVGIDVSPGMLAVARRELPAAELIESPAERLPVTDASIDLVTCVTALHIFADPVAVLAEAARVLAPGGALVAATFALVPDGHGHGSGHGANHAAFATPELLDRAAAPAGLHVVRHERWDLDGDHCLIAELRR